MLAGQIEDQKIWVGDISKSVYAYACTVDPMIPKTIDTFENMRNVYSDALDRLKLMRKSLVYALEANGVQLTPDQRQTPELYV